MKKLSILTLIILAALPFAAIAETGDIPMLFYGEASWYGEKFHGRQTASGEIYDMHMLSAAHKTLPFGTLLRVTNLENDRSVTVRVNDRGPFVQYRVLDLSMAAAALLDFQNSGLAKVEARVVQLGDGKTAASGVPSGTAGSSGTAAAPLASADAAQQQSAERQAASPETAQGESAGRTTVRIIRPEDVRQAEIDELARQLRQPQQSAAEVLAAPNGRFVIQAGAFLSLDNAEGLLRRYKDMGLPVYLRQLPGEHLQRVWVGPFASRADAEAQLARVRTLSERAFIHNRE